MSPENAAEYALPLNTVLLFICVVLRISVFVWLLPLFPKNPSARYAKIGLAFFLSLILTPLLPENIELDTGFDCSLIFLALQEIGVGFAMGFIVYLLEAALLSIGSFLSQLMGLEMAQTIAPGASAPSSLISQFCFYLGVVILITVDGHHFLINALALSLEIIPPGTFYLHPDLFGLVFREWNAFFRFVLLLGAPFLLMFFVVITELGILGRMVPQMNIFMMEYPIRLGGSIILLAYFLPAFLSGVRHLCLLLKEVLDGFCS